MKRFLIAVLAGFVALAGLAGTAAAKSAAGKVVAVEGDKVTVQLEKGSAADFPVGTSGVEVKGGGKSVKGKVLASGGNKVTIQVKKGAASSLAAGAAVEVEAAEKAKAGGEELQGC